MENKKQIKRSVADKDAARVLGAKSEPFGRLSSLKNQKKNVLLDGAIGILYSVIAFLFATAELPFSTYPMGLALLSAADTKIIYIVMGLGAASLVGEGNGAVWILTYTFILLVRVLCRMLIDRKSYSEDELEEGGAFYCFMNSLFSESIFLRMATSAIAAFSVSLYSIVVGGFRYYDLFGAIFAMLASPLLTLAYSGVFMKKEREFSEKTQGYLYEIAVAALVASSIYALRGVEIFGISLSIFIGMFATLYICKNFGLFRGLVAAISLGLCIEPLYSPVFALGAIAMSGLGFVSVFFAAMAACVVGMAWGIYIDGIAALSTLFPALLSSSMLFCTFDKILHPIKEKAAEQTVKNSDLAEKRAAAGEEKLSKLSSAFSSLSEAMFGLSNRLRKPEKAEIRDMCDNAYDKFCPMCEHRELCWGAEYEKSAQIIDDITKDLYKNGAADRDAIPEYMKERCHHLREIVEAVNQGCALLSEETHRMEKTEVFALDYEALSEILSDALKENREEYESDGVLAKKVSRIIAAKKIKSASVSVFGGRKKQIVISGLPKSISPKSLTSIRRQIEAECGTPLAKEQVTFDGDSATLVLENARTVAVKYAHALYSADGKQDNCGDTVSLFENNNDLFYSLLCDGMGSGRNAALNSGICSIFMQKMLSAGNRVDTSMRMLNSFMRSKGKSGRECSTTVDLLELDLLSGRASFIKSGAASSFVIRGGEVYQIHSKTMPIGIVKGLDAEKNSYSTEVGDIIVMVSDGVSQCENDLDWLFALLRDGAEDDLSVLAQRIIERAAKEGSEDDRSAIVIKIEQNDAA